MVRVDASMAEERIGSKVKPVRGEGGGLRAAGAFRGEDSELKTKDLGIASFFPFWEIAEAAGGSESELRRDCSAVPSKNCC